MLYNSIVTATALLGLAAAQVHTDCNPMERDCPANPAFGTDHNFNFNITPSSDLWETTAGTVSYDAKTGAAFTINKQGDSPTLRTKFYFFFGRTEIHLKVAPGRGIVSSMMWLSDDLDEVDWEFLGSNKTFATTNYFGKGRQDFKNGGSHPMTGMQDDYHNYTTVWTKDSIEWFIDGNHVRTLNSKDANNTHNYPQTPMRMSVGIWAGGDPSLPEGTRLWAGGDTDYANGPYTMYLKSAQVTDYSSGKEYTYGDRSGSWESIKIESGNSTALDALNKQPDKSTSEKWNDLPTGAKAGVYAGGGAVGALALGTLLWYYIRQRRIGAAEAKAAALRDEEDQRENARFLKDGINPDGFTDHGQEYNARELRAGGMANENSYHVPESSPFDGPFDEKSRLGSSASNVSPSLALLVLVPWLAEQWELQEPCEASPAEQPVLPLLIMVLSLVFLPALVIHRGLRAPECLPAPLVSTRCVAAQLPTHTQEWDLLAPISKVMDCRECKVQEPWAPKEALPTTNSQATDTGGLRHLEETMAGRRGPGFNDDKPSRNVVAFIRPV
ncbi:glycoside hydrolase family 16 protein [Metarhizium robertsii]|uniref:chitinase n=2 Tax=Metarhizium robertsii TaxID=568076 RepID=E9ELF0_METRA|nr:glycosyl hydrolase family 16 [Metarhizium robertsii ARSEF 23]EFZ03928.1 glycosyl hydrolase family 16 [Metarhizium robertsii ARSEF 23]EXU99105.1 glycoside hydrolase family 16 protein [Metarhizium robertsii]